MTKIAYLIGAGASARTLPVVQGMADAGMELLARLNDMPTQSLGSSKPSVQNCKNVIGEIIALCKSSASIDTHAKILSDSREFAALEDLKQKLVLYFSLLEVAGGVDNRYENFFAGISHYGVMPQNMSILSWNYDLQIETAMSRFLKSSSFVDIRKSLGFVDFSNASSFAPNEFNLVKLNGSACFHIHTGNEHATPIPLNVSDQNQGLIDVCMNYYKLKDIHQATNLRFAWEDTSKEFMSVLIEKLERVHTLVVIGYSFPSFNRSIDKRILAKLNPFKVILQYPKLTGAELFVREVLKGNSKLEVVPDNDVEQFHIPFDFF
ncbi:MAG: hypothetical protein ACK52I_26385 [Pseudomonadota bacterium]